jgi:hypothetical protein
VQSSYPADNGWSAPYLSYARFLALRNNFTTSCLSSLTLTHLHDDLFEFNYDFNPNLVRGAVNWVPAPILVGVETNPGPPKKGGGQSKPKLPQKQSGPKQVKNASSVTMMSTNNSTSVRHSAAPLSIGSYIPRIRYEVGSNPQKTASQDARSGIRVTGCAMVGPPVQLNTNNAQNSIGPFGMFGSLGGGNAVAKLSPNTLDPRLAAMAQTYQYYAFRRLKATWVPNVGSQGFQGIQGGANAFVSGILFFAIVKDYEQSASSYAVIGQTSGNSPGTLQNVLETDPSFATTIWQPCDCELIHTGTELRETFPNGEEPVDSRIQAGLVAMMETSQFPNTTTANMQLSIGRVWIEYVIDFYVPGPPLGAN